MADGATPTTASVKEVIATDGAPKAIGPYSQGIVSGGFVFASGMIGLDPATGTLVEGGTREQTIRALENLKAVLEAGGSGLDKVVKTTVLMVDIGEYKLINEIYASYFAGSSFPARAAYQVAALPAGARVEIEAIAAK